MNQKSSNFLIEPEPFSTFRPAFFVRIEEGRGALDAKEKQMKKPFQEKHSRFSRQVYGIVLHQMGFSRGDAADKYDAVTAHYIITQAGNIAQLHTVEECLYSSNHLNDFTIAVEFAGNFQNDKGQWWKGYPVQNRLTPRQVSAGLFLLETVQDLYEIRTVFAHRQGTGPRRANCCGPEIWRSIAERAILTLGYEDTRNKFFGNGSAIPETWRARRVLLKGHGKILRKKE